MSPTRVLVVEDSLTVRKHLVELLAADPEFEVVGEADDGRRAIELCRTLRPDVMTLDIVLRELDGLAVVEHVMAYQPTPVLIVSGSFNRRGLYQTFDALAAGAVDVLEKPRSIDPVWGRAFIARVKLVARIKVVTHLRGRLRGAAAGTASHRSPPPSAGSDRPPTSPRAPVERPLPRRLAAPAIVALGASTGGPRAVAEVLASLPSNFPLPILVVVHLSEVFGDGLTGWLSGLSPIPVSSAVDGTPLSVELGGRILIAPPGRHTVVEQGVIRSRFTPARHGFRPSVDPLFESVADEYGPRAVACLLTGMGSDGAQGLLRARNAGALTIAQDEASSVVFGMPREAIALGAATHVLGLDTIAAFLASLTPAPTRGWR